MPEEQGLGRRPGRLEEPVTDGGPCLGLPVSVLLPAIFPDALGDKVDALGDMMADRACDLVDRAEGGILEMPSSRAGR